MLDDTLVIWGGEFGRTPTVELPTPGSNAGKINGRDHNHYGFTMWLAGGGVKGGHVHGATDEFGFKAVENTVHVHDLHATILHLLGFDHEKLTYRYAGRDFRLTDVHGKVVQGVDRVGAARGASLCPHQRAYPRRVGPCQRVFAGKRAEFPNVGRRCYYMCRFATHGGGGPR